MDSILGKIMNRGAGVTSLMESIYSIDTCSELEEATVCNFLLTATMSQHINNTRHLSGDLY